MLPHRVYFSLRPCLPRKLRLTLRRLSAVRTRAACRRSWPIDPGAAHTPAGWTGWPRGKQFAVVLTHDIEREAGLHRCVRLLQLEQRLGFVSSFNLVPHGSYRVPPELRATLTAEGCEIGVHDWAHDGHLFASRAGFRRCATEINRCLEEWGAVGFRSGFMLRQLDWLHELNIAYDSSTFDTDPFEPQPDGVGSIFPFLLPPQGFAASRPCVELPYTLPQDFTLFALLREPSIAVWRSKVDWIARHGGMVLVDTHPDYMNFGDSPERSDEYPVRFYEELLRYLRERYAGAFWHALPAEVARFTRATAAASPATAAVERLVRA